MIDPGDWAQIEAFVRQRLEPLDALLRQVQGALAGRQQTNGAAPKVLYRFGRYGPQNTGVVAPNGEATLTFPVSIPAAAARNGQSMMLSVMFVDGSFSAEFGWRFGAVTFNAAGDLTQIQIVARNNGSVNAQADVYLALLI